MKIKLLVIIAVCAALVVDCLPARAQDTAYKGNEFAVDLFGGVSTPDLDSEDTFYGFGVQYYATPNIGVGVFTSFEETEGHFFENVSFRGLWRVPFEKHAFYAFGGATRQLHVNSADDGWSFQIGPGYEFRPMEHVGLFAEIGMSKVVTGEERPVSATARAGIRFSF